MNSFTFPGCDFCVDGDLSVHSSQVIVGDYSFGLLACKERGPPVGEACIYLHVWRSGSSSSNLWSECHYAVPAVFAESGIKLLTDFSKPPWAPRRDRGQSVQHEILSGHRGNSKLRECIESGRPMTVVMSFY